MLLPSPRPRRLAASLLVLGFLAASCGGSSSPKGQPSPSAGSIAALRQGAAELSLLSSDQPIRPGSEYFGFELTTSKGQIITGGTPQVWVAPNLNAHPLGPFPATWFAFTAYQLTADTSPRSPLPGTYASTVTVPSAGNWVVVVTASDGNSRAQATGTLPVTDSRVVAQIGTKAVSVPTPVATTEAGLRKICTRNPPDHLHSISLDKALKNGKPTVVAFATPLLCMSQLCGPVVDEVILASQKFGSKANFIHVEEFLPGPDLTPPPPSAQNQSPGFKAWGFTTEPWVIVIDGHGIIRARFEGPVTAPQIEAALQPLL